MSTSTNATAKLQRDPTPNTQKQGTSTNSLLVQGVATTTSLYGPSLVRKAAPIVAHSLASWVTSSPKSANGRNPPDSASRSQPVSGPMNQSSTGRTRQPRGQNRAGPFSTTRAIESTRAGGPAAGISRAGANAGGAHAPALNTSTHPGQTTATAGAGPARSAAPQSNFLVGMNPSELRTNCVFLTVAACMQMSLDQMLTLTEEMQREDLEGLSFDMIDDLLSKTKREYFFEAFNPSRGISSFAETCNEDRVGVGYFGKDKKGHCVMWMGGKFYDTQANGRDFEEILRESSEGKEVYFEEEAMIFNFALSEREYTPAQSKEEQEFENEMRQRKKQRIPAMQARLAGRIAELDRIQAENQDVQMADP